MCAGNCTVVTDQMLNAGREVFGAYLEDRFEGLEGDFLRALFTAMSKECRACKGCSPHAGISIGSDAPQKCDEGDLGTGRCPR